MELALQLAYKVSKIYIYNNISHIKKGDLIMEVKGLEMSGSFYFENYDKVKANF